MILKIVGIAGLVIAFLVLLYVASWWINHD